LGIKPTLEKTEVAIKNEQNRETGYIGVHKTQDEDKSTQTQHRKLTRR